MVFESAQAEREFCLTYIGISFIVVFMFFLCPFF
jgi:hypothetical protein